MTTRILGARCTKVRRDPWVKVRSHQRATDQQTELLLLSPACSRVCRLQRPEPTLPAIRHRLATPLSTRSALLLCSALTKQIDKFASESETEIAAFAACKQPYARLCPAHSDPPLPFQLALLRTPRLPLSPLEACASKYQCRLGHSRPLDCYPKTRPRPLPSSSGSPNMMAEASVLLSLTRASILHRLAWAGKARSSISSTALAQET